MSSKIVFLLAALVTFLFFSCDSEKVNAVNKKTEAIEIPSFNAEYAYDLVQKQVDFGPRVPETESHAACAEWLKAQLNAYGWKTDFQSAEVDGYDGKRLNIKNIAFYNTTKQNKQEIADYIKNIESDPLSNLAPKK